MKVGEKTVEFCAIDYDGEMFLSIDSSKLAEMVNEFKRKEADGFGPIKIAIVERRVLAIINVKSFNPQEVPDAASAGG